MIHLFIYFILFFAMLILDIWERFRSVHALNSTKRYMPIGFFWRRLMLKIYVINHVVFALLWFDSAESLGCSHVIMHGGFKAKGVWLRDYYTFFDSCRSKYFQKTWTQAFENKRNNFTYLANFNNIWNFDMPVFNNRKNENVSIFIGRK